MRRGGGIKRSSREIVDVDLGGSGEDTYYHVIIYSVLKNGSPLDLRKFSLGVKISGESLRRGSVSLAQYKTSTIQTPSISPSVQSIFQT